MQFLNKSMLESEQKFEIIDLTDYVFNHQGFKVTHIIFRNLKNANSMIWPTQTPPGNPFNDY